MNKDSYFSNKRVLVTGGTGFIGVNLIKKLIELGADITATIYHKKPIIKHDRVQYINADLRLNADCEKVFNKVDYVFMCAANTSGAKVMATTPLVHLTPNINMNVNSLEAAYKSGVKKFLFISSSTVYPLSDFPVDETNVTNEFYKTYHIVGWMKRFTEIVCDIYQNRISRPMNTIVLRPGNLYGPFDKFDIEKSKVIPALIRRAVEKKNPFDVWGDGNDLKDFLYIEDFVNAAILAMEKIDHYEPINIGSGIPVTIRQVLNEILRKTNFKDANVKYDTSKPSMIPKRLINISLAKEKLGWTPEISISEGISRTIEWYKLYYKDANPDE